MPALEGECPNCGHGRYWVERSGGEEWKRCTECNEFIGDEGVETGGVRRICELMRDGLSATQALAYHVDKETDMSLYQLAQETGRDEGNLRHARDDAEEKLQEDD